MSLHKVPGDPERPGVSPGSLVVKGVVVPVGPGALHDLLPALAPGPDPARPLVDAVHFCAWWSSWIRTLKCGSKAGLGKIL